MGDAGPRDAEGEASASAPAWAARGVVTGSDGVVRCAWGDGDAAYRAYHDGEWGRPSRDERHLFEMLVLEGAQAGLSWSTILRKRDGYRLAFAGFDPAAVAAFGDPDVARLLGDPGIVRNRLKVESAVANARAVLALRDDGTSLADLLWGFVGGAPVDRRPATLGEIPAETAESRAMSRELKRRGFRFVGPTVCYALMQAVGLVNDHVVGCAAGEEIRSAAR
jgi:DNA-3-methyladenine glycosylase I